MTRPRFVFASAQARRREYSRLIGTHAWKQFRGVIKARDGWKCTYCGNRGKLEVHHELSFAKPGGLERFFDPSNCRTICTTCHVAMHQGDRAGPGRERINDWQEFAYPTVES